MRLPLLDPAHIPRLVIWTRMTIGWKQFGLVQVFRRRPETKALRSCPPPNHVLPTTL